MKRYFSILPLLVFLVVSGCGGKSKDSLYEGGLKAMSERNYNGAIVHFKNALESDPNFVDARYQLGLAYLEVGKVDQAEKEFSKVQMQNPYDAKVRLQLARIFNFQNKPDAAIEHITAYLSQKTDDPEAYDQLGLAALLKGNPMEAAAQHRKALQIDGARLGSKLALAQALVAGGDLDGAEETLDDMLKSAPNHRAGLYLKAQIEARRKDADGVLQAYSQLASVYPGDTLARYKEASIRAERGEAEKAWATAESLVKEHPDKAEGYKLRGLLYIKDEKFDLAVAELQRANKIQPDLETNYLLGIALSYAGNPETAISQFQLVLDHAPDFAPARMMLGNILLRLKRPSEALAVADKLLEKNPGDVTGLIMRGDALLMRGDWEQALTQYDLVTAKAQNQVNIFIKKGAVRASHGMANEAERDFKAALAASPKSLDARMALHSLYMQTRRPDQAEAVVAEGISGGKSDAVLYNVLAKSKLQARAPQEAVAMLEKAKAADPAYLMTYHNLASFYLAQNQMDKAVDELRSALAVKPDDLRTMLALAAISDVQGKPAEALEILNKARQGGSPEAFMALARFQLKNGKTDEGMAVVDEFLAKNPQALPFLELKARIFAMRRENDKALDVLSRIETINARTGLVQKVQFFSSLGDFAKAQQAADKLVALAPDSAFSYMPLAAVTEAKGDFKGAQGILAKAVERDPKNVPALLTLAQMKMRDGADADAEATFDKALRQEAGNPMAFTGKGILRQKAGDKEGAVINYRQALQSQPDFVPALNNLSMIYADKEGMQVQALNLALAAYSRAANDVSVADTLGYALLKNKRFEEGLRVLERAESLNPKDSSVLYHQAMVLKELGRKKDALAKLQPVLADKAFPEQAGAQALSKSIQAN